MKIFKEITFLLFIVYSFIKFKVLVNLPKSFHGPLDYENALYLDHVSDHNIDWFDLRRVKYSNMC